MNHLLPVDIIKTIIVHFGATYEPLFRHTCHLWSDLLRKPNTQTSSSTVVSHRQQSASSKPLCIADIAFRGQIHLIEWISQLWEKYICSLPSDRPESHWPAYQIMYSAVRGGHESIMRLCRDKYGLSTVGYGMMILAATHDQKSIVRLCYDEWRIRELWVINESMCAAASGGYESILRLCHDEYGADNVEQAMSDAAFRGHESIVRICHNEWNATDVNRAMADAARGGREHIVRLCHDEWGATNVQQAIKEALLYKHDHIVRLCRDEWGSSDVE